LLEVTGMKNPATYKMAVQILEHEVEHEEYLQVLMK